MAAQNRPNGPERIHGVARGDSMDVDSDSSAILAGAGWLFIRRQVFEHALTLPALTGPLASRLDVPQVATKLSDAREHHMDPAHPPTIRYTALVEALSQIDEAFDDSMVGVIVESLVINAADAFVAVGAVQILKTNSLTALSVPITELLAFIKLHSVSRNLMVSSRETADSVWPDEAATAAANAPSSPVSNTTTPAAAIMSPVLPASIRQDATPTAPMSPRPGPVPWNELASDAPLTPRRRRESSQLLQSPTVKASAFQDVQRETQLVIENITALLRVVVFADTFQPQDRQAADEHILIQARHVDHLAFLLSTRQEKPSTEQPVSSVVPEWRQSRHTKIPLPQVAEMFKAALRTGLSNDSAIPDPGLLELTDLDRRTVIRSGTSDAEIRERDFRLAHCSDSYIYLLAPLSRVSLVGCVDCTVFVGAAVSLSIWGGGRNRVIAAARRFRLTNCVDSTFYLCTNRKPQIVGDNRGIQMAPYSACYPNIQEHARAVGIDLSVNKWNEFSPSVAPPVEASPRTNASSSSTVTALLPERFTPFMVPIAAGEVSPSVSTSSRLLMPSPQVSIPQEFLNALVARNKSVEAIKTKVKRAQADLARRPNADSMSGGLGGRDFSVVVQEHFREWLSTSGNMRQMNDLMRLEQEFTGNSRG